MTANTTAITTGVITALQLQKRNKDRVNVFVDGEYAFAVSLTLAATLHKGQRLAAEDVEALKQDGEVDLAYQRALRYLGMRPRSSAEIVTYLKRKEYDESIVEIVVNRLHKQGYLDDEAFARFWVENRNRFRPRGSQALRYELRQKGVERETIDSTLEEQDDDGAAWAAVEGKLDRWAALEKMEFEQKLMAFLARRGFRYDVCRRTAEQAWQQVQEAE
ncbi:MAG: RecX family transcriptional regulator [Caldilineaceae bacterium]|nr:RecX family transcriptional regulator [Caldilineaceae bacterium]